jgi:hypothetical protein
MREWFGLIPVDCDTPDWIAGMTPAQVGDGRPKLVLHPDGATWFYNWHGDRQLVDGVPSPTEPAGVVELLGTAVTLLEEVADHLRVAAQQLAPAG